MPVTFQAAELGGLEVTVQWDHSQFDIQLLIDGTLFEELPEAGAAEDAKSKLTFKQLHYFNNWGDDEGSMLL